MPSPYIADGNLHPSPLSRGLHLAVLPNGLKVIIKEDHRTPVAVCNVWVKVGSNREPQKLRGWSHGIEHMLFKGTERRDEGDFAREVACAGGSTNAGTGYETTNYHITVPAPQLSTAVDILSDALFHSTFEAGSLDAERQVLVHENHMYDDIPFGFGVTWRWGLELAYDRSPYANPIGGRDENLLERDRDEILAFWRSAYRPDNMTCVVCGDVDPQKAFALVVARFGDRQYEALSEDPEVLMVPEPMTEGAHDACRLRVEHGDIQRAYAKLIFKGPGDKEGLSAVLSVVRRVLNDGRSCRLHRVVQEELKLVDDHTVMTETGPREGIIIIDLETDATRLAAALHAVCEILDNLGREGATAEEMERARVRVRRAWLMGEETVQGQASTLGHNDAMGDLEACFDFPDQVDAVDNLAVKALCRRYFRRNELSCVIYLPEGTEPAQYGIPATPAELDTLLEKTLPTGEGRPPITVAARRAVTDRNPRSIGTDRPFEVHQLSGGTEVCVRRDTTLPLVAMALSTIGGATNESETDSGLSTLMQMVQVKGTGDLNSEAIFSRLEGLGAAISPRAERDYAGLFFSALSDRLDEPLDYLGRLICTPSFPEHQIEHERRLALEQLASLQDNPFQAAAVRMRELIYGDHPYGRPLPGSISSLPHLTREMLLQRHAAAWTTGNLKITLAGDFDTDAMLGKLEKLLEDLPRSGARPTPCPADTRPLDGVIADRISRKQNQSIVLTAWPGPRDTEEHRVPLMMLKEVLNGQAGRLFEQLRNQRSLCYNTGTVSTAGFGQGMFLGYVLTAPERETEARDVMLEVLGGLTRHLVEGPEFEMARSKLLGNLLISSQAGHARVSRTARDRIYGRDANDLPLLVRRIEVCNQEEVLAAARAILDEQKRFEVIIGP